jgi:hypothetical protein
MKELRHVAKLRETRVREKEERRERMRKMQERSLDYPIHLLYTTYGPLLTARFTAWHYLYFLCHRLHRLPVSRRIARYILQDNPVGMRLYINGKLLREHRLKNNQLQLRAVARYRDSENAPTP